MNVQQSTTYETTGAVTAGLAQENGDLATAGQIGPAAPIPGVSNEFILGPNGSAVNVGVGSVPNSLGTPNGNAPAENNLQNTPAK